MTEGWTGPLEPIDDTRWRIPRSYLDGMRTDGVIVADAELIARIRGDRAPEQVANVACLPGIVGPSLAMPDIHWGYGFPIGGVMATDPEAGGVVSPGGVGYDINCGVRLVRTNLRADDVRPKLDELVRTLFRHVPTGAGIDGPYSFSPRELKRLMAEGVGYLVDQGLATEADRAHAEDGGCLEGAEPDWLSERALKRGSRQCGTLGSGNHFLEVQAVDEVVDAEAAAAMGLEAGTVCVLIHSGSRGLGHQVCTETLKELRGFEERYGIAVPDRQLACAPIESDAGRRYLGAMRAAANFAFCNRQLLMTEARGAFEQVFGRSWEELGMELIYDVAHNIAKFEEHMVPPSNGAGDTAAGNGGAVGTGTASRRRVCVHRKGATRAFPPGHPELPAAYRGVGQPVFIPGDMGRASWVLVGAPGSMELSFGTTCHGAGRQLSRRAAVRAAADRNVGEELRQRHGVVAMARSDRGLAEEAPAAYKDVDHVVGVVERAGLSRRVARMRPLGVIKG